MYLYETHLSFSCIELCCIPTLTQANTHIVTDAQVWLYREIHLHRVHLPCATFAVGSEGHSGCMNTENDGVPAHHLHVWVIHASILPWMYLCRCLNADVTSTWRNGLRRDGMCVAVRHYISPHPCRQTCCSADPKYVTCESAFARKRSIWLGCPWLCVWVTLLYVPGTCLLCTARSAVRVFPCVCSQPGPARCLRAHGTMPRTASPLAALLVLSLHRRFKGGHRVTKAAWHLPSVYLDILEPAAHFLFTYCPT